MDDVLKEMNKLHNEYTSDVTITPDTLYDITLRVPALKSKWIQQLYTYQKELKDMEQLLLKLNEAKNAKVRQKLKVDAPASVVNDLQLNDNQTKQVIVRIDELGFIINNLKKYVNIVTYLGRDVENVIAATKLEIL